MIADRKQIPETPVEDEVIAVEVKPAKAKVTSKAKAKSKVKPKAKPKKKGKKPGPKPWATNKLMLPIDQAEELGRAGVTMESLAEIYDVDYVTIHREFQNPKSEFARKYKIGKSGLRERVRTALIQRGVEGGSDACLIFLSKNLLGYTDRPLVEINNTTVQITEEPLPGFLEAPQN